MSKAAAFGADPRSGEFACERLKPRIVPAIEQEMGSRPRLGQGPSPGLGARRTGDEGNPAIRGEKDRAHSWSGPLGGIEQCSARVDGGFQGRTVQRSQRRTGAEERLASGCASVSMPMTTPSIQSWPRT